MDYLTRKARRTVASSGASKASSKSSARRARKKKREKTKQRRSSSPSDSGRSGGRSGRGDRPGHAGGSSPSRSGRRSRPEDEDEDEDEDDEDWGTSRRKKRAKKTDGGAGGGTCGGTCASCTAGALHVIDIGLGISLLVYGSMVHVPPVTAACVAFGLLLSLGAISGAAGYYSESCGRKGLLASSVAGGLACLLHIVLFVSSVTMWDSFMKYLDDNQEALMLDEGSIGSIKGLKFLFAAIFIILAGLEGHRCLAVLGADGKGRGSSGRRHRSSHSSSNEKSACERFLALVGLKKSKKTDDMVTLDDDFSNTMESALLPPRHGERHGEEEGSDASSASREEYLSFVPEHEGGLANFAEEVAMPKPPEEKMDY